MNEDELRDGQKVAFKNNDEVFTVRRDIVNDGWVIQSDDGNQIVTGRYLLEHIRLISRD